MSDVHKISIALTGEQISLIKDAVEEGRYATTSEVVREAIRDWQDKIKFHPEDIKRLRRMVDEGKASGRGRSLDWKKLRRTARGRLAKIRRKGR